MREACATDRGYHWSGKVRWPFRGKLPASREEVGRWGEWLAMRHLRRLGWDIVARNWRTSRGELDLVAYDEEQLVVVEVRTRQQGREGIPPEETVGRDKIRRLESLAGEFLYRHEIVDSPVRFDLIAIETPDLRNFTLRHMVI